MCFVANPERREYDAILSTLNCPYSTQSLFKNEPREKKGQPDLLPFLYSLLYQDFLLTSIPASLYKMHKLMPPDLNVTAPNARLLTP
jgi:hypothetical protein